MEPGGPRPRETWRQRMLWLRRETLSAFVLHRLNPHAFASCAGQVVDAEGEAEPGDARTYGEGRDPDHRFQRAPPLARRTWVLVTDREYSACPRLRTTKCVTKDTPRGRRLLGWRRFCGNRHGAEPRTSPRDGVDPEPLDLVVTTTERSHVVDDGLQRADRALDRHRPLSGANLVFHRHVEVDAIGDRNLRGRCMILRIV